MVKKDRNAPSILDKDISNLIDYALDHGIEKTRISQLAHIAYKEFLQFKKRERMRRRIFSIFIVCIIAVITLCFFYGTNVGFAILRISLIKIIPIWDWTSVHKMNCLIPNPFYDKKWDFKTMHDCLTCHKIQAIPRLQGLSSTDVLHRHLVPDVPVIMGGATGDWLAKKYFSFQFLMELYTNDPVLSSTPPCMFSSNLDGSGIPANFYSFMIQKQLPAMPFYLHWENCDRKAVKVLRQFYRRPMTIHSSIDIVPVNWLIVTSNHNRADFILADIDTPVSWLVQIKGSFKIRLEPSESCNSTCSSLYAILQEGDMVLWTQPQWSFSYKPTDESTSDYSIAMLFGGLLD